MAIVDLDTLKTLEAHEDGGVVTEVVRSVLVRSLTAQDFKVLMQALDAAGVPKWMEPLEDYPQLVLTSRRASIVSERHDAVTVELRYQRQGVVSIGSNLIGEFKISGGTSLQNLETMLDLYGQQIVLEHTYAEDDPEYAGLTVQQGGKVSVMSPQGSVKLGGRLQTNFPEELAAAYGYHINASYWLGRAAGTWLCSGVSFDLAETNSNPLVPWKWDFQFEFTHKPGGWQPGVIFTDSRTQGPPPDLVEGLGYKTVEWYPEAEFNAMFPT